MLTPDRIEGRSCVSVPAREVTEGVSRLKSELGSDARECDRCGYEGPASRWGIREVQSSVALRTALVVCCPACERTVDVAVGDRPD